MKLEETTVRLHWLLGSLVFVVVFTYMPIFSGNSESKSKSEFREYTVQLPYSGPVAVKHMVDPLQYVPLVKPNEKSLVSSQKTSKENNVMKELEGLRNSQGDFNWFTENKTRMVYVKLHKVGGTSIAAALGRVSNKYGYKFPKNILNNSTCLKKHGLYNISFIHSPVTPWMKTCLPGAQYVIVLREPVSGYVSHLTWWWNREYFTNYPDRACNYAKVPPDEKPTEKPFVCYDDAYRKKVCLDKLVKTMSSKRRHLGLRERKSDCSHICNWFSESSPNSTEDGIKALEQDFSLVGVTEHLDAFLLLIALQKGWSMDSILYRKCKLQGEAKVSAADLKKARPDLNARINWALKHEKKVYRWAKERFELLLSRLGPAFDSLLQEYKARLKIFNEEYLNKTSTNRKRWVKTPHGVGYC